LERCEKKQAFPDFPARLKNTIINMNYGSQSLCLGLNPGPSEYEAGVLPTQLQHSVSEDYLRIFESFYIIK
jgi:hypothetical protein